MWLARQTAEKVLPRIHKVLEAAKDEYADCVAHSGGIYAAGYCFGAKYVLILAGAQADGVLHGQTTGEEEQGMVKKGPLIKAGAIAHATLVTREDVRGIKVPMSIVAVENDPLFPEEILDVGRKHLATTAVEHEIKVYKGVPHGFAVMGEYAEGNIKGEQEKAFEQMVGWLKNHS
jgi:dienelactone hydrolase